MELFQLPKWGRGSDHSKGKEGSIKEMEGSLKGNLCTLYTNADKIENPVIH